MVYTYLLKSIRNGRFYVGISIDPFSRVGAHNRGGIRATKDYRPWNLIHTKIHYSYSEARKREKWLKKKNKYYKERLAQLAPPTRGGVKQSSTFVK